MSIGNNIDEISVLFTRTVPRTEWTGVSAGRGKFLFTRTVPRTEVRSADLTTVCPFILCFVIVVSSGQVCLLDEESFCLPELYRGRRCVCWTRKVFVYPNCTEDGGVSAGRGKFLFTRTVPRTEVCLLDEESFCLPELYRGRRCVCWTRKVFVYPNCTEDGEHGEWSEQGERGAVASTHRCYLAELRGTAPFCIFSQYAEPSINLRYYNACLRLLRNRSTPSLFITDVTAAAQGCRGDPPRTTHANEVDDVEIWVELFPCTSYTKGPAIDEASEASEERAREVIARREERLHNILAGNPTKGRLSPTEHKPSINTHLGLNTGIKYFGQS
ncbi:hypothetical protein J6590_011440 [Homalodisca vitripennis]|nr:hypothetical protein J6590_011440 [Homalodisca vitripennis]